MSANTSRALAASFAAHSAPLGGAVGFACAPVGGGPVVELGEWSGGVAWSTSKVPLAVAALRAAPSVTKSLVVAAITRSDNAAAEQLWSLLGTPAAAAGAVEAVLRDGGDTATRVRSLRVRPEFTAFGQTEWSAARQARFTARLPNIERGPDVLALMRALVPEQRWGLARLPGAAVKGGWGPDEEGTLVRQLAVLPNGSGRTAVVVGAVPDSGIVDDGIVLLDRLAEWVGEHLAHLPTGDRRGESE
ncbi:hypothetical protein [Nocardia pseudobrasiliensis]|uniref:Beta-lactamase class A n=1 Tax=Nocardia pseudobrasiliensis TaxID=45979 RepID=A0A370IB36_9NOCA|nr:hypothetical protein [Nocardia pseudobrasiliensis]RDI67820.1 hypothetical protein DFR76_102220 [Nocardia pseudobrasiliensis]